MATDHPVGVGLIGCGSIGQIHADGLAKLAQDGLVRPVVAADPSASALQAAVRNCPFERTADEISAVFDTPGVDAVIVAGPTATHEPAVTAAIERGLAVHCEKPIAPTFSAVERMCELVRSSGVVAQVGFHSRQNPLMIELRTLVRSGELGRPLGYVLREDQFWPTGSVVQGHSSWRSDVSQSGGGPLLEHTIHGCDLLVWMFGPATRVGARTRSLFGFGVEDLAVAHVEHSDGAIGTVATAFNGVEGREERRLEVFLEHATIEVTGDFIVGAPEDSMLIHRPRQPTEVVDVNELRNRSFADQGIHRRDFLFYQYLADRAFVRAVQGGEPASPGFDDALGAHRLVDAAYRSAADDGTPIEIPAVH